MIVYTYTPGCAVRMDRPHSLDIAEEMDQRILDLLAAPVLWYELQTLVIIILDELCRSGSRRMSLRRRSSSAGSMIKTYAKLIEFCECNHGSWVFV